MIYTRFGMSVKIIGQCGQRKPGYLRVPGLLARIQYDEDEKISHMFIEFLKADGGWAEICDVYNAAPVIELKGAELKKVIREAM